MDKIRVVRQYFAAWRRGDAEHLATLLDDHVTAIGPLATVHGAHEHAASLVRSSRMLRDIAVDQMLSDDTQVLSWFRLELRNGSTVRAANRCEVVDGVITQIEVTFDPRPLIPDQRA
jgi:ketosteroid isomerase-like protein